GLFPRSYVAVVLWSLSQATRYLIWAPLLFMNVFTSSTGSSEIETNSTSLPLYASARRAIRGITFLHGSQKVAQNSRTTTFLPAHCSMTTGSPWTQAAISRSGALSPTSDARADAAKARATRAGTKRIE